MCLTHVSPIHRLLKQKLRRIDIVNEIKAALEQQNGQVARLQELETELSNCRSTNAELKTLSVHMRTAENTLEHFLQLMLPLSFFSCHVSGECTDSVIIQVGSDILRFPF